MLDYGIVGNCKTCALVKKNGSVDWMCYPSFDSPTIFAKLLDKDKGGHLFVRPVGKYSVSQRYLPNTAILETLFESEKASFKIMDFFPRYRKLFDKKHERLVRQNRLVRLIVPLKGVPKLRIVYKPAPNYALDKLSLVLHGDTLHCKSDGHDISLVSNIPYDCILNEDVFELKHKAFVIVGSAVYKERPSVLGCVRLMTATKKYWERWVGTLVLPEANRDIIIRSAITLKLLTYSETGAIIAAPTTSIPEIVGSQRCWDYRFCWARDASFTVDALKKIGRSYEAKRFMEFVIKNTLGKRRRLQIMYGLHGEAELVEKTLPHLDGFMGSKPVRIGNAAHNQKQNDIYGSIIDVVYLYYVFYHNGETMPPRFWKLLISLVDEIEKHWLEADNGIWEFRRIQRHHTYSKLMCFVGVDRAVQIAQFYGKNEYSIKWVSLRDRIKEDILHHSWNDSVKAFTMFYSSSNLDASILQMCYHDFLPLNDPRLISTVMQISKKLTRNKSLVMRYIREDGLGEHKSAFTICSFWMVDALYHIGHRDKAREMFEELVKRSNHLGLFSEDMDVRTKKLLGNFPQAYTHVALINSAVLLSEWGMKRKKIRFSFRNVC